METSFSMLLLPSCKYLFFCSCSSCIFPLFHFSSLRHSYLDNDLMLQLLRQPSTDTGHSDLLSKQGVCELMLQRLDVLLWFCTVKLLPEVSRELVCFDFGNVNNGVTCFCFDFILKMYWNNGVTCICFDFQNVNNGYLCLFSITSVEQSSAMQGLYYPKDALLEFYSTRRQEVKKLHS